MLLQTINDSVTITGDVLVDGKTQLGNSSTDSVTIAGAATIAGPETVQGNLSAQGNVQLGSSLINTVRIAGNLSVAGNTQLGISVIDTVNIAGNLTVNGNTQLGRSLTDTVNIAGNESVQGNLTVNGNTQLGNSPADTVMISGNENVQGDLLISGNTQLGNQSSVDSVLINAELSVIGDTKMTNLDVDGDTQLGTGATDTVNINGQGFVKGNFTIDESLVVSENTQLGNLGNELINIIGGLTNSINGMINVQPKNNIAILGAGNGIILTSPNNTNWLLTVNDEGNLVTKRVSYPKD